MIKSAFLFVSLFVASVIFSQTTSSIAVIPQPVKLEQKQGYFTLPQNITIQTVEITDLKQTVVDLQQKLSVATGYKTSISSNAPNAVIKIRVE